MWLRRSAMALTLLAAPSLPLPAAGAQPTEQPTTGAAQPATQVTHFDINEFRVEGNTVLSETDIDDAIYDFLGPGKTAADVEKARAALEATYARKGFPTVSAEIPVQHVTDGVVILMVTERKVGRLRVKGSRYYALSAIRDAAPSLAEGKVPNMPDVQRDIVALNQWPGRTVTPTLRAGVGPGTVDVDLQVDDQPPLHGSVELNNRQAVDTKPLRASATLSYDNLWQRGDSASLSYQIAPQYPPDAKVVSASYLFRVPDSKVSLLGSYVHSDSNVTSLGSTNVVGRGTTAGFRVLIPLGFQEGFVHTLSVGMDYKDYFESEGVAAATTTSPVTYYPITLEYQASWSGEQSRTDLDSSVVFTIAELGQRHDGLR